MLVSLPVSLLLLLHEGGWDEVIMVAVGLVVAYLVIVWTGRHKQDDDEDQDVLDDVDDADPQVSNDVPRDRPPRQRP
jgi:nitrogen fixation-related uncharacterized protein